MKKLLLVAFLLTPFANATNFEAVDQSGNVLDGALRGALNPAFSYTEYIAEYGLHFTSAAYSSNAGESQKAIQTVTELLPALASTVKDLGPDEWVSASYAADTHVIVRIKPNQPDTLEVWVDGVKR